MEAYNTARKKVRFSKLAYFWNVSRQIIELPLFRGESFETSNFVFTKK